MFALEHNFGYPRFDTSRVWSTLQHLSNKSELDEDESKWLLSVLLTPLSIDIAFKRQAATFLEKCNPPWMSFQTFTERMLWLVLNELKICAQDSSKPADYVAAFLNMVSSVPWSITMDAIEGVSLIDLDKLDVDHINNLQKILRPVKLEWEELQMPMPLLDMPVEDKQKQPEESKTKVVSTKTAHKDVFQKTYVNNLILSHSADWEVLDMTIGQFGINVHPWIMQRFLSVSSVNAS